MALPAISAGNDRVDDVLERIVPRDDRGDDAERVILEARRLVHEQARRDLLRLEHASRRCRWSSAASRRRARSRRGARSRASCPSRAALRRRSRPCARRCSRAAPPSTRRRSANDVWPQRFCASLGPRHRRVDVGGRVDAHRAERRARRRIYAMNLIGLPKAGEPSPLAAKRSLGSSYLAVPNNMSQNGVSDAKLLS